MDLGLYAQFFGCPLKDHSGPHPEGSGWRMLHFQKGKVAEKQTGAYPENHGFTYFIMMEM